MATAWQSIAAGGRHALIDYSGTPAVRLGV
jgi:hypothetical protein